MKLVLRWFPYGDDSVTLKQIRQIPGVSGVATHLTRIPVGDVWTMDEINLVKDEINSYGLEMEVIESLNIHEDIKKGLPSRDMLIDNYIESMRNLSKAGVKCICYNFMPVMDWYRSNLAKELPDGSNAMAYSHSVAMNLTLEKITSSMIDGSHNFSLPGWEPERFGQMAEDIKFYQNMSSEDYFNNIKYFLDAVIPVAEECDINFAVHPDDPPMPLFNLPKVVNSKESINKYLNLNTSKRNGLTLCTGSLGAGIHNDVPDIAKTFTSMGKVHFVHLRNVKHETENDFHESAHLSSCGDLDMLAIVKALYENGFDGYIRPDHGRMIWDEVGRPGYGLYDRALGATYINGLWEAVTKLC
ncbi:MAG: mannonate dehydratase [Clostridiales bacterium]|nr:mannonate dehydratase [Clostridiales bacterium]